MKISYQKDVEFSIPHISALGMEPPEGKELSDFVCWVGFEDKDNPYLSSQFFKNTLPLSLVNGYINYRKVGSGDPDKFTLSSTYDNINFYAVWDKFTWMFDNNTDARLCCYNDSGSYAIWQANRSSVHQTVRADKYGFNITNASGYALSRRVAQRDTFSSIDRLNQYFIPNYNIKYAIETVSGKKLNNVYLNGELFAGKDVTEEYWNSHRNDLYRGIDPELSVNHIWEDGKINDSVQFIYPITSCHVSSDKCMHISCDVELLSGEYSVHSSYDEVKDKMTDNGSRGFFE